MARPEAGPRGTCTLAAAAMVVVLVLVVGGDIVHCARILFVLPIASVSHQVVYQPVLKELARRGHQVVSITPNPIGDPRIKNLRELDMSHVYLMWRQTFNFAQGRQLGYGPRQYARGLFEGVSSMCENILNTSEVTNLLANRTEQFDLIIVEWLLCPMMAAFAHRFNAPLTLISSTHAFITGHDLVANPTHPVYQPDFFMQFSVNLDFWQRLYSTFYSVWFRWYIHWVMIPHEDRIARKYFRQMPYLGDMFDNVSLLLTNTHPILGGVRPLVPTTIEFGGMVIHKKPEKPLPQHLQKFLDEAEHGAIYFSLGTNVRSVSITKEKRSEILAAFAELPYRILWKWELDSYQGLPSNVHIEKWLPQQDILRHRNVKAFFTQGGLQSFEEALHYCVPIVVMPFFADQDYNADRMVYLGIGERLEINTLTKDKVKENIRKVVNDKTYKEKICLVAKQVYDRPMKPVELVAWWIEYTLRHNGTRHLQSPVAVAPFYKYFLVDVVAFLVLCVACIIYVVYKFCAVLAGAQKARVVAAAATKKRL